MALQHGTNASLLPSFLPHHLLIVLHRRHSTEADVVDGTSNSLQSPAINGPTGWLSLYVVTSSFSPSSELIRNSLIVCLFVINVDRVAVDRMTDHKTNERGLGDTGH